LVYTKFYLPEIIKQEFNSEFKDHHYKLTANRYQLEEELSAKVYQRVKELLLAKSSAVQLPTMNIEFCIRGIGNHDQLPYLPVLYDEDKDL
jgi:hypothetical protein